VRLERPILKSIGPFDDAVFEAPPPSVGRVGELVLSEGPNGRGVDPLSSNY
jgi:hypothetical protein